MAQILPTFLGAKFQQGLGLQRKCGSPEHSGSTVEHGMESNEGTGAC